ncbi:hypothetical protein [Nostoc sp.]|uniref:hypothetical protein n=1 Tax=Nostoc sp. TaxID=1180 RepID=UPI002FF80ADD
MTVNIFVRLLTESVFEVIDFLHESKALTLNPSPKLGGCSSLPAGWAYFALQAKTMAMQAETMAMQAKTMALQTETMALQTETMALSAETMALSVETMALSAETMPLSAETINLLQKSITPHPQPLPACGEGSVCFTQMRGGVLYF